MPTNEEAIEIFARYFRARYGVTAIEKVKSRANELQQAGDDEGYRAWNQVARELGSLAD